MTHKKTFQSWVGFEPTVNKSLANRPSSFEWCCFNEACTHNACCIVLGDLTEYWGHTNYETRFRERTHWLEVGCQTSNRSSLFFKLGLCLNGYCRTKQKSVSSHLNETITMPRWSVTASVRTKSCDCEVTWSQSHVIQGQFAIGLPTRASQGSSKSRKIKIILLCGYVNA